VLSGKVLKFSITFPLSISPDYAPYPINGILRDHRQFKSEFVLKVFSHVRCVPTIITSSLIVRFERVTTGKIRKLTTSLVL
jgi:hypothetical protein